MIKRNDNLPIEKLEHLQGGDGTIERKMLLNKELLCDNGRAFGIMTLKKGCGIGKHKHEHEFEAIYILEGTATYDDNGTITTLNKGDMSYCPDGESHSIKNECDEDLVFVMTILNSNK